LLGLDLDYPDPTIYDEEWDYTPFDDDLVLAFDGIVGLPTDNDGDLTFETDEGNFRDFVKTRIKLAMAYHSVNLNFTETDTDPDNKELWYTEYNISDGDNNVPAAEKPYVATAINTLAHAIALQGWFLLNMKFNTVNDLRPDFFTRATLQNYLGGSPIDMLSKADQPEQILEGLNSICSPYGAIDCSTNDHCLNDYYEARTLYYEMLLLSNITSKHLKLLKSTTITYINAPEIYNLPPTIFIDDYGADPKLYVYYTNILENNQRIILRPSTLVDYFSGATGLTVTPETITSLDGLQVYSTAGASALFDADNINSFYSCSAGHDIEIDGLTTISAGTGSCPTGTPTNAVCVLAPPSSCGYIVYDLNVHYRLGTPDDIFAIYPNPASTRFIVHQLDEIDGIETGELNIEVYNINGNLIQNTTIMEGESVDISNLPVGIYNVLIKTDELHIESETLVKMK
jgi:hypothetical protein